MGYFAKEGTIDPKTFNMLRKAVGWEEKPEDNIELALRNTKYMVTVNDENGKIVGMARVIGDEGIIYYIQDVIVLPECQGEGVGKMLIDKIMEYLEAKNRGKISVGLMAAIGKEGFYRKYGFREIPNESQGHGMIKKI